MYLARHLGISLSRPGASPSAGRNANQGRTEKESSGIDGGETPAR